MTPEAQAELKARNDDIPVILERISLKMQLKQLRVEIPEAILWDLDALRRLVADESAAAITQGNSRNYDHE